MKKTFTGILALCVSSTLLLGQSIYSFEGLGSLEHQGMPNNFAMGEVGIGSPSLWHVNTQNPANLVYNSFSTFQLGLELDNRRFSGSNISGRDTNGSLRFLTYAFPIIRGKWSSSFGILPYSSVNYNTFSEAPITGISNVNQISDFRGEGGLTHFYWANGFRLFNKLMVGFRANFTFGSIDKESVIFLQEISQDSINGELAEVRTNIGDPTNYQIQESFSDVNFLLGLSYRHRFSEKVFLDFGLTYAPQIVFSGTQTRTLTRIDFLGNVLTTQDLPSSALATNLPETLGVGLSFQKQNVFTLGVDLERQNWSEANPGNDTYTDFVKVAVGANWVPDYDNVSSYFKRAKYSLGFNRTKLPYIVNQETLIDFGINFGASFPVSGFSSLDLGVKIGQLGDTNNGGIRENYYKIVLGATINDRWFIQRKYD